MYKKASRQKSCLSFQGKLTSFEQKKMPKVRRSRKPPPEGWELIEPTLDELDQKMREGKFNPSNIAGFSCVLSLMSYISLLNRLLFCNFLVLQLRQNHMKGNERQSPCGLYLGNNAP